MSQPFNLRRHRRRPVINLTSLIDTMFILLIFLMVTSTFKEGLGIQIDLPEASTSEETEVTPRQIAVDAQGNLYFAGQPVDEVGLRKAISDLIQEEPNATLILRADKSADFGKAIRAIDIAREVGGTHLIIPTDSPDETGSTRKN